jgi:predicted nucleotidyltransferase
MSSGRSKARISRDERILRRITRTIAGRFHPRRILLFGSRARGQGGPESDFDLFVEMDTPLSPPRRAAAIHSAFGLRPWAMDVVVYTPREVRRLHGVHGTLLSIIEEEGRVLYAQP